ncbi:ribonuclease H-like domain-containing protein [Hyaloraphidium curvatum]|nr:ribonuclease H-like domain-containing protein [Hyaloraphidium curvatum]
MEAEATPPVVHLRETLQDLGLESRGNKRTLKTWLKKKRKKLEAQLNSTPAAPELNETAEAPTDQLEEETTDQRPRRADGTEFFDDEEWSRIETLLRTRLDSEKRHSREFLAVLDVEATCEENRGFDYDNEIIEWPVVLLCGRTNAVVAEFRSFVRPTVKPELTEFCVKLTGITQDVVYAAPPFTTVLEDFQSWLRTFDPTPGFENILFVTDGPWDLRDFLRKQCLTSKIKRPRFMNEWCDLRTAFSEARKTPRLNLDGMLTNLGLTFAGKPHCGIDDARNIARIVQHLVDAGVRIAANDSVPKPAKKKKRSR